MGDIQSFLLADLAAYGTFLLASLALARGLGAATGASVAFILMYAVHLLSCSWFLHRKHELSPDRSAARCWFAGLILVLASSAFGWRET